MVSISDSRLLKFGCLLWPADLSDDNFVCFIEILQGLDYKDTERLEDFDQEENLEEFSTKRPVWFEEQLAVLMQARELSKRQVSNFASKLSKVCSIM